MLQHECPLAPAAGAGEAGFMTETTGKTCLPCCCDWMPVPWPLTWRPGRWRARRARPAGLARWGTAGNGRSGCAGAGRAATAAAGAVPVLPPHPHPAAVLVRAARADGIEVIGTAAGLAMAGAGHRPVAAAFGVPAATARGWLRLLRAHAGQLRAHAIGELNGLGFYPPGPSSEPAGSPLGDALNALATAVDCARRNFGHGPEMTWPLVGRLGLARFLMPAPAS
jgi:hypothetical protein